MEGGNTLLMVGTAVEISVVVLMGGGVDALGARLEAAAAAAEVGVGAGVVCLDEAEEVAVFVVGVCVLCRGDC